MPVLLTEKLTRQFGDFVAVDALDLSVEAGEVFGLLGPNGAGKSTALKMLTTLLPVTSGRAWINGFELARQPNAVRRSIGYVPQMLSVDGSLTAFQNLMLFARLYDIPWRECRARVEEGLEYMGLSAFGRKEVREFSGGMIRRLEIAQSMMHRPQVLFLDEPTVGLDPIGRKSVWDRILDLKERFGTTVILTTHLMDEADKLCGRVALLSRGKLAALDAPAALKRALGPEATLEDVFIHFAADTLQGSATNYRGVALERKTSQRMG